MAIRGFRVAWSQLEQVECRDKNEIRDGGLREAMTLIHFSGSRINGYNRDAPKKVACEAVGRF